MSEPKLKAKLFVHAAIRQCGQRCLPAMVVKKGDDDSGTIVVRVVMGRDASRIYTQVRDVHGRLGWMCATGPDPVADDRADAYVTRICAVDSDAWVLDVESPDGKAPFLDPIFAA